MVQQTASTSSNPHAPISIDSMASRPAYSTMNPRHPRCLPALGGPLLPHIQLAPTFCQFYLRNLPGPQPLCSVPIPSRVTTTQLYKATVAGDLGSRRAMPRASPTSGSQPDSCRGMHRNEGRGINRRAAPARPASPKAAGTSIQHPVTHSRPVLTPPAGTLLWTVSCLILYTAQFGRCY